MATIARSQAAGFTDYGAEAEDIARRRKMAEMMQMQALEPIKQETAGGYVVPISWTQGLAKALQAGLGGYQQGQATRDQRELVARQKAETAQKTADFFNALRGSAGTPGTPDQPFQATTADYADNPNLQADESGMAVNPGTPGTPAVPPDRTKAMAIAMGTDNPMLQGVAGQMMTQDMNTQRLQALLQSMGMAPGGSITPTQALAQGGQGPTNQAAGMVGQPTGQVPPGMSPLAWRLLLESGDVKAMATAVADAAKPGNRFLAGREGPIFDVSGQVPQVVAINPKVDPGMMPVFGPNSQFIGAQAIPGYAQGRAGIRAAETTAVEGAKAGFDIVKVPDGRGGTIDMPRSQLVQLLQPQQAGSGIVRGEAPNDAEALRQATELNDQGRQFSISTPPTSGAVQPQQPRLGYSNPAAEAAQKETGKNDATRVNAFEERIPTLVNTQKRLNRLLELTNDDKTYAAAGAEIKVQLNRIAQGFGISVDPTKTANSEEYIANIGELLKERLSSKDYGSGTGISNLDLISASVPLPELAKSVDGRRQIIEAIMQDTQNSLANSRAISKHFRERGTLNGFEFPSESDTKKYGPVAVPPVTQRQQIPSGIPLGSTPIGKTPTGKTVYRAPNGKQYVE